MPDTESITIPVTLGKVSVGVNTVSVGVKADKAKLPIMSAEHHLIRARLDVQFYDDPGAVDDTPGQQTLGDVGTPDIDAVANVLQYGSRIDEITFSMSFSHSEYKKVAAMANKTGRLIIERTGDAGGEEADPSGGIGEGDPGFDD